MTHPATPSILQPIGSRPSPVASQLRGGRLTKLDGEVASCAPSLGRTSSALLSSAALAGILSGAFLAMTAQEAQAACIESAGAWTCTGVVTAAQSIKRSDSAISVNLDSGFDMDVAQGVGFTLEQSGAGGIAFVQAAGGQDIVGRIGAVHATNSGTGGISITATGKLATTSSGAVLKAVNSDASGGSVSVSVGSITGSGADGHAIQVTNSGIGTTTVTASGAINSGSGQGDGVNVETGRGIRSVAVSVATVTGGRTGVRVNHRGAGSVSVRATGTVKASGSHTLSVANRASASSIRVTVASVTAQGNGADGIHVLQKHRGNIYVSASGSVTSVDRHGIFVDQRRQSGTPRQSALGNVRINVTGSVTGGGGRGDAAIKVDSDEGDGVTIAFWSGSPVVGRAGEAGIVESNGNASVSLWAGVVKGDVRLGRGDDKLAVHSNGKVSGSVDLGHGNDTLIVRIGGQVSGGVNAGDGDDKLTVYHVGQVSGGVNSGDGDDTLTVRYYGKISGGVNSGDGNDTLTVEDRAQVSGGVDLGDGNDTLTVRHLSEVFGGVNSGDGNDTLTVEDRAQVSGGVDLGDGNDTLTVRHLSEVSGTVDLGIGSDTLTVSDRAEVSDGVDLGDGDDTMIVSDRAEVSGTVDFGIGNDTLTVSGGQIFGDVDLGAGDDELTVNHGEQISGTVDFGVGSDSFNFGPGLFEVIEEVSGAERFTFGSGAVVHVAHTNSANLSDLASLEIKSNAIAILDNAGFRRKFDSIRLKQGGILNIADGVAGSSSNNGVYVHNISLLLGPSQEFNGTLILDANFAQSWADGLGWDGTGSRNWRGTVLIEPAVLAGRQGNSAIITNSLSASQIRVPEGFSLVFDTVWQQFAIRQDMENGTCASAGGGAFTCKNLIHETQSLSATGESLDVTLNRASVVHVLAGTRQGLSLRQSGTGGISLTQSATGNRIAAAGHAILARNAGLGSVSVAVTGPVVGGLTGRVADAVGIVAEGGPIGSGVHISAASVTGLRHGISVSTGRGVFVEASGSVIGRLRDGVNVETGRDSRPVTVSVSVATVTGGRTGVWVSHRGAGSVSVRATGTIKASGVYRDGHAIFVTNHDLDSSITVAVATVTAQGNGTADGIHVRQPHGGAVTVIASGSVSSVGRHGIYVDLHHRWWKKRDSVKISVSGSVTGGGGNGDTAIKVNSGRDDDVRIILESGAVVGRADEDGIIESHGNALVEVKAGAALKGDVYLGRGDDTMTVSDGATVSGDVKLSWDNDTMTVGDGATISGNVDFKWGYDTLTVSSATISGNVNFGSEDDTMTVSDGAIVTGDVDFMWQDDTLTVSSATISGNVNFGSEDDTMTVSDGAIVTGDVDFMWQDDTLTVSSATISGDVDFWSGKDTMTVGDGAIISGNVDFKWQNDTMTVIDGAIVSGDLQFYDGDDTLTVSNATVSGDVDFWSGKDTMTVGDGANISGNVRFNWVTHASNDNDNDTMTVSGGATVSGNVDFSRGWGSGHDTMTVSGGATVSGNVNLDQGHDKITVGNGAALSGTVDFGDGNDTLTARSSATISGDLDLGDGADTVTVNSATVSGDVDLGRGGDTLIVDDGATVSGDVDLGAGYDMVIVSSATVSGDIDLSVGNDTLTVMDGAKASGGVNLGAGDDMLTVRDATVSGGVDPGAGDDTLTFSSATISGNLDLSVGNDTVVVSDGTQISGGVKMFDGDDTLTLGSVTFSGEVNLGHGNDVLRVIDGATVSGDVNLGPGDNTATISNATVSGDAIFMQHDDTLTISEGAKVLGDLELGNGNDTLTISGATFSNVVYFRYGDDTLIVTDGAKVSADIVFANGDNTIVISDGAEFSGRVASRKGNTTVTVSGGATVSGRVGLSGEDDSVNFGPGFSEVTGNISGDRFTINSGAIARIARRNIGPASIEIKSAAVAILDTVATPGNAGVAYDFSSFRLRQGGTLNIADGVAGSKGENGTFASNISLRLGPDQQLSGTLVVDANFAQSWVDGLAWNGSGSRNWRGTMHIEPAILAGGKGNSAAITGDLSTSQLTAPEGFSIVHDAISGRTAIRQDMASGTCTAAGSGAFACRDLIHETQSLSATGEALNVTLDRGGVVHALAGSRRGLSLSQSGTGGISLTQSSTGSRIAAAGHAIHARNAGAGDVSVTVTGLVVGGLTGRVADADGIAVENGSDGGDVHISAASVTGLRHGIAASAGAGGVSVEASGPVTSWFGDGVRAVALKGDVTVTAASVSGGSAGILGSGTGAVSIRASGVAVATGYEGVGIDGLASGSGALSISATAASGAAFGIRAVSKGSGPVSVTATGAVKGGKGAGIHGLASGSGALSISAAEASGASFGIRAVGRGSGTVSVSASGSVTSMHGASRHGIHARASGTGGLTVSVDGDVRGGETGITALGGQGGDVAVTTSGRISFGGGSVKGAAGIHATAHDGDLTILASGERSGAIAGEGDGIRAASSGTGAVSISATAMVIARNGDGISVTRAQVGRVGVSVSNVTMAWRDAGVAGTAAAIRTDAPSGSSVTVSLNSGAYLSTPGADAVAGGAGDATVTVKSGATVQGRIALGSGTDTLVFDGGSLSGVERMDGGAGSDTLRFASGTGTLHATVRSEGLKGWERIVVESGAALRGGVRLAGDSGSLEFRGSAPSGALDGGSGTANTLSLVNVGTASVPASGLTGWETIAIGAGSEISFGTGAHTLTAGSLTVEAGGVLNVGKDADTGDALTVSGDFAGGGTVTLNANFMPNAGASDRLTVTGDARGATSVVFAKVGESGTVDDTARPMRIDGVISVAGAVGAGAFVLGSPIQFGMVSYSLAFDADSGEYDLLMTGAGGDAGALSHGAAAAAGALHFGPAATEALHSGPAAAAALHIGPAATAATLGAQAAAAGLAAASRAACREAPSGSGAFFCGGAKIGSPQRLGATGATALSVKLDTLTAVDTDGTAFSLTQSGTGGIAFERKEGGAAIRAKGDAIAARNAGGGSVSISARGAIAAGGDGASAISDADGEGVRIDVATVAAGGDGVSVETAAGGVSITADDVKGRVAGIRVRTGNGGTGVEISAGSAEGGSDGISVEHGGSGEVRITATGAVSGARGDGVHARSDAGSISVRVSGEVSGGAAAGTAAIRTDGASAAVTLEDGASVRATGSGSAVMDGAGAALVTVREGASILGGVSLGAGADELVLAGGDFGGITSLDGGSGRDALRIEAGRGSLPALSNGAVSGFESVIVSGDAWIEGDLLLAEDAGELVFADGARIDGHGRLDGGGGASLSLRGVSGEMDAARLSGWTSLEIGEGSRVTLAGAGLGRDAAESLLVAGTMAFGSDARAGDAFTVEGDFEGGGRVEIDADLAAGSADRLVIEGDVSGTTEIALRDLTPRGAEPSGAEMTVVSVGGEADASAFRLAGGAVARGAFLYDLRMAPEGGGFALVADGGVSDTGAALQSASAAIARGLARATTLQARAAARAATSVWARVGSAATFAERGAALAGRGAVDLSARESRSVWMRFHGDRWDYGAGGAATIDSSGFEVGMDLLSRESSAGKWIAGLTAQYGTVGAEAAAGGGVGRQGASGYGVGATLSWLGYGGFYADAQAQAGISDSDFSSDTGGAIRSGVSARTALAALELGWRVAASDGATITPQAQISMSGVSGDRFVSGSLDVADRAATSLDGRVGLAAEIALREGYLRFSGSLLRALSEMDGTVVNGRTVEHGLPDGWAEFAVGGSLDLSEDRVLFLDGTWRTGLGGDGGGTGAASISGGLKVNW